MIIINYFKYIRVNLLSLYRRLLEFNDNFNKETKKQNERYFKYLNKNYYFRFWYLKRYHAERFEDVFDKIKIKINETND